MFVESHVVGVGLLSVLLWEAHFDKFVEKTGVEGDCEAGEEEVEIDVFVPIVDVTI